MYSTDYIKKTQLLPVQDTKWGFLVYLYILKFMDRKDVSL